MGPRAMNSPDLHIHARLLIDHIETPIGRLAIVAADGRLRAVGWIDGHARMQRMLGGAAVVPASNPGGFTAALRAYFAGDLRAIDGLPVTGPGPSFSDRSGARSGTSLVARRSRTARWPAGSASRRPSARWASPTARTRSASSSPATASSARTAGSRAMAAASIESAGSWRTSSASRDSAFRAWRCESAPRSALDYVPPFSASQAGSVECFRWPARGWCPPRRSRGDGSPSGPRV